MLQIAERTSIGTVEGKTIEKISIVSSHSGFSVSLITLGATVSSVKLPDRQGNLAEVTLGHDSLNEYLLSTAYLGSTIGRVANRIRGGEFLLDGQRYGLTRNDHGLHCIHGGERGFHRVVWDLMDVEASQDEISVPLTYTSPHMEEGFPGNVQVTVVYRIREHAVRIDYHATADRSTLLALTNHTYWNLEGVDGPARSSGLDLVIRIQSDAYLPVDETLVPTGEILSVSGTPLDFRTPSRIRDAISLFGDIDNCFVLNRGGLRPVAELYAPHAGRVMTLETDQPGLQLYTGNVLEGLSYRSGVARKHQAICLEAQAFPDAIHHPSFPSIILRADEAYLQTTIYSFGRTSL